MLNGEISLRKRRRVQIVKRLSQLRKRAGQSGEQKRRPRLAINYTHDPVVSAMAMFRQLSVSKPSLLL
jgi:hypothetical protein